MFIQCQRIRKYLNLVVPKTHKHLKIRRSLLTRNRKTRKSVKFSKQPRFEYTRQSGCIFTSGWTAVSRFSQLVCSGVLGEIQRSILVVERWLSLSPPPGNFHRWTVDLFALEFSISGLPIHDPSRVSRPPGWFWSLGLFGLVPIHFALPNDELNYFRFFALVDYRNL